MKRHWIRSTIIILLCSLSGCVSASRAVVDPSFPKVSYNDLRKLDQPLQLKLSTEFQRNGQPFPQADSTLRDTAERVLRATGLIQPATEGKDGEIRIVVNNIADMGNARAKGIGTGLTFGALGTTVTDAYSMNVKIIKAGGETFQKDGIKHSLHTAIGNTSLPAGLEVLPPGTAFGRVVEQMLIKALKDLQETSNL